MTDIWPRLRDVFRDVFDDEALTIGATTTAKDIEAWDSLNHVNLIVAVEKAFKIKLTMKEATGLPDVGALAALVERKIALP
jgi:acyl carrier protein